MQIRQFAEKNGYEPVKNQNFEIVRIGPFKKPLSSTTLLYRYSQLVDYHKFAPNRPAFKADWAKLGDQQSDYQPIDSEEVIIKQRYNKILLQYPPLGSEIYYQLWKLKPDVLRVRISSLIHAVLEGTTRYSEYQDPQIANGACSRMSHEFENLCSEKFGILDGEIMHYGDGISSFHDVFVRGNIVIDWTARQYPALEKTNFPYIYRLGKAMPWGIPYRSTTDPYKLEIKPIIAS